MLTRVLMGPPVSQGRGGRCHHSGEPRTTLAPGRHRHDPHVWQEEAAYCDPGLISGELAWFTFLGHSYACGVLAEVVVPLLSMSNSVLLCISTLLDSGGFQNRRDALTFD